MEKTCKTCARGRDRGAMVNCVYLGIIIRSGHTGCRFHDYGIRRETEDDEIQQDETSAGSPQSMAG